MKFVSQENENHTIEAEVLEGFLTLSCVNFNSALGTGTSVPIEIGMADGKKLMLHLWFCLIGQESVRKVEYSIFKEKE